MFCMKYFEFSLELKTSKKYVRPSVGLSVCTLGRLCVLSERTVAFDGVSASKQSFVGVFYVSNFVLIILTLNRI